MPVLGFHAQHEQASPRELLESALRAEQVGFDAVMCSDHLAPWSTAQGHSGFTWTWLGAALQATQRVPISAFHAPGQRYHPVISAHAIATAAAMFPGRVPWIALGSGEALNEHVTGEPWPTKDVRTARLGECVEVMRALWRGEEVTHRGLVTVDRATLYDLPDDPPQLVAGAMSEATARWAASWADGLVTTNHAPEQLVRIRDAYRDAGGRGPLVVQVHLSYADDLDAARRTAWEQWRTNCLPTSLAWELETPEQFEAATRHVPVEEVERNVLVSADLGEFVDRLGEYLDLGADALYLHPVGPDDAFLDAFGEVVLPQLRSASAAAPR